MLCATTPTSAKRIVHFKLQILRLEERCTRHIPQSATFLSSSAPSLPKIHCKEAKECHAANFAKLRFVLQEGEVLEASTRRVRSQRAPTGITKLQSSYLLHNTDWSRPAARAGTADEGTTAAAVKAKAGAKAATSLPPPLTHAAHNEAYTQLTPGAEQSIKSVIEWWRTNKLSDDDVLATVTSFHGSSAALRKIFQRHALEGEMASEGEVASEEEMYELSRLMCV